MSKAGYYTRSHIMLHWVMAILMIAVYALIELRELYPKGSDPRELMKALHFMLGLSVCLLVVPRLIIAVRNGTPAITPSPPVWQTRLARATHGLIYLLMLGLPLAGWMLLSAAGKPIPFFGLELPPLVGENKALAKEIKEWHELGGKIGYLLIGLHIVGALFHHHVAKDDTLRRMLPMGKA